MNKPLILVVEDDSTVRNLITTTLKSNDYRYITASNGEAAIMAATTQQPDIVFLDLGLPDLDGVEIIRRIRTWSQIQKDNVRLLCGSRHDGCFSIGCCYVSVIVGF